MSSDRNGWQIFRRHYLTGLTAGSLAVAGCSAPIASDSEPTVTNRRQILDRYSAGRAARRDASEAWSGGRDAWVLRFFDEAATSWRRAATLFTNASTEFERARRACERIKATEGAAVCDEARTYSHYMGKSADDHASAAEAFAAGDPDAGRPHLDRGWEHYQTAIEHSVPKESELQTVLPKK